MSRAKAFTLVELLVGVVLTGIGVVSMVGALSGMTRAQIALEDRELVYQLAQDKYDEIVATGLYETETGGEFEGKYAGVYSWSLEVVESGTQYVQSLRLTVTPVQGSGREAVIEGLVMNPPETTTAPAGGTGQ